MKWPTFFRHPVNKQPLPHYHLRHDRIDWGPIIASARQLDIVVFYYDHWVKEHHDEFVAFFRSGGTLNITFCDPGDKELMKVVHAHFFEKVAPEVLSHKVNATVDALTQARTEASAPEGSLVIHFFKQALHFSFVMVDEHTLYLSMFEQFRGPTVRAPVFEIDLWTPRESAAYWINVRNGFRCGRRPSAQNAA